MTNWEIYIKLLAQNNCLIDHEGDEYYDYPFIYYNNIKQNKWFMRINYSQVQLDAGKKIESHINQLNYLLFKDLYNSTVEAIQSLKEVEEWRNKLVAKLTNPANNENDENDDKICNITLNLTYSQCKGGSK
jgi:hypothetical protein